VAQRGRGAVDVADPLPPRQHAGRLVEGRGDAVADLLLPVARRVAGQKKKKEGRERWHKDREATQQGARRGGRARLRCRARDSDAGRASDAGHLRPPSQTSTKESPCCPIPHAWPHPRRSPCSWAGSPVPIAPRVQDPRRARAPDRPVPLPRPPPLPRNSWRADSRSRWATPRSALAYAPSSIARRTASISCHSSGSSPPTAGSPSRRWRAAPGGGGGGGVSPPPPSPGLYMTKAHFVDDFEGWLKGSPEFEVHILGQKGQTDSLTDYQCAGEQQPAPYTFDQNELDWSGSVMLFSKAQLDAYNAKHPGQNVRVFVVEDDDTACEIKTDRDILGNLFKAVDDANKALSAGNDSSSTIRKDYKRASAFQKLWAALAAFFNTNDELVGNAVEDVVVGASYPGYNWIVKGENNVTNGWINLQMK